MQAPSRTLRIEDTKPRPFPVCGLEKYGISETGDDSRIDAVRNSASPVGEDYVLENDNEVGCLFMLTAQRTQLTKFVEGVSSKD